MFKSSHLKIENTKIKYTILIKKIPLPKMFSNEVLTWRRLLDVETDL